VLTYRELNSRANQLARYLRKIGVGPEVLVAICAERSLEMIIGLVGILKAGGAYVPLDPTYPKERLAFMLKDSRAPVLLAQSKLLEGLPGIDHSPSEIRNPQSAIHNLAVVCLDTGWDGTSAESEENPAHEVSFDNLAYVIYTSGSTGKPKGVSVTHRGVVRLVKGTDYAQLTDNEIFFQFAPLTFDASTFEIWGSLLNGAKLVVFAARTPSLEELGQALEQTRVTTLWLTSALFQLLVENQTQALASIKQLLTGGDILSVSHVKRVLNELPGCRLINGYGPTENTTFTCCYPMTSAADVGDSVSIGRPIANTEVFILDRRLNPVPIGVVGELVTGGDGLARSYFNNPELTAEKFIPNPYSDQPGARLYKTGDVVRYQRDGNLEFLGRIDHQVKIRGFRIELGEIESVLSQHPAVRETVVVAREDDRNADCGLGIAEGETENSKSEIRNPKSEKRLVAYVVPKRQQTCTRSELNSFLRQKLPDYMLPSAFVFLDGLPLNPNGKVDRKSLPAPGWTRPGIEETFVAPRNGVERAIAGIWAEVLKLDRVGIHDNFFDLGGHSLKATQVMSRIRQAFELELPLRSLFEASTVAGLAELLSTLGSTGGPSGFSDAYGTGPRDRGEI
jgi:amino acid adenylation domain-containing protein